VDPNISGTNSDGKPAMLLCKKVEIKNRAKSKKCPEAVPPTFFCSRHPYLVFKIFGSTPG